MRSRLRPGEELAIEVHRHWMVLGRPFVLLLFLAGGLVAALFVHRPYVLPAAAALAGASGLWALWRWLEWRADLWAVTSQRVIDEWGVLTVHVIDSPLDTIHNVSCEQTLAGRMFGYGTLNIQTAAEHGSTTIPDVAAPEDLRETILEVQQRYKKGGSPRGSDAGAAGTEEMRECPYCAETIKAKAKLCRFCGRTLA